jgi:RNA polymerase sigma-70 factor (ECF subfamily)
MTHDDHLAEDLTQEAFLQVFRKIHSFRGDSSFFTWLYRIAVNIVLMNRRVKRLNETPLEGSSVTEGDSQNIKQIGRSDTPVSGLVNRLALEKALNQLPLGRRHAFVLHDVLGFQHGEIAKMLGCSVGTSKSQLHKARTHLRRILRFTDRLSRRLKPMPPNTSGNESQGFGLGG